MPSCKKRQQFIESLDSRWAHLLEIFLVLVAPIDHQQKIDDERADQGDVDGLVSCEPGVGEHIVPVHRCRQNQETAGEGRQVGGQTLCLIVIGRRSDLQRRIFHA